jgi:hypothetical protein
LITLGVNRDQYIHSGRATHGRLMTWFKVDDGLAMHPKVMAAGNNAMGLWVRAGAWSAGNLTDGFIPRGMIPKLGGRGRDARKLVEVGLWLEVDQRGYQFHEWEEWQPSKQMILDRRAQDRERKANRPQTGQPSATDRPQTDQPRTRASVADAWPVAERENGHFPPGIHADVPPAPTRPDQ